mmetsp:Transcript_16561/g.45868  ORF Transcript_16561/g.45868 Transcript_16561/m.45868 type:complete len:243 (+) Transcript_16561:70-798(+)
MRRHRQPRACSGAFNSSTCASSASSPATAEPKSRSTRPSRLHDRQGEHGGQAFALIASERLGPAAPRRPLQLRKPHPAFAIRRRLPRPLLRPTFARTRESQVCFRLALRLIAAPRRRGEPCLSPRQCRLLLPQHPLGLRLPLPRLLLRAPELMRASRPDLQDLVGQLPIEGVPLYPPLLRPSLGGGRARPELPTFPGGRIFRVRDPPQHIPCQLARRRSRRCSGSNSSSILFGCGRCGRGQH